MELQFNMFFNTHKIYVTFGDKIYKLNRKDLSKEEVSELPTPSKENNVMILHKSQFDMAKGYLLDIQNPFRINIETARLYNKIGFLSNDELKDYQDKLEKEESNLYEDWIY
ncbi:MAG: hypothetical protein SOX50_17470 [Terrisporobacter othiniensis]|uniref:hypothetical protein n=1 Tax=Terrisporobacter othiniensis TaxID=1577792 RepID=UPI002A74DE5F|nr:hypothetical protein [Terrisporobacter othiniensis]MDY3375055.1 hypothetical protein [Terrisporobacter othiniensis]